jgi:GNAT superfamily N-acetyltransferase
VNGISIRPASSADQAILTSLAWRLAEFELPPWRTAEEIARADGRAMSAAVAAANPDDAVFIAERAGEPVGCLHMLLATDFFGRRHAHISVIAATAAAQRSGVGRALLAHAEDWARAHGMELLTLNVFAGNTRARRVYERAGFGAEALKYTKPL